MKQSIIYITPDSWAEHVTTSDVSLIADWWMSDIRQSREPKIYPTANGTGFILATWMPVSENWSIGELELC